MSGKQAVAVSNDLHFFTSEEMQDCVVKVGRPSKYRPEFCEQILNLGARGKSVSQMASYFNVNRKTLDQWALDHEEFSAAFTQAKEYGQTFWENVGEKGLFERNFNSALYHNTMRSRYRGDYGEHRVNEITGLNGGPIISADYRRIDVKLLAPEDRDTLKMLLLAANPEDPEYR